jgi:hypothetical protein
MQKMKKRIQKETFKILKAIAKVLPMVKERLVDALPFILRQLQFTLNQYARGRH